MLISLSPLVQSLDSRVGASQITQARSAHIYVTNIFVSGLLLPSRFSLSFLPPI